MLRRKLSQALDRDHRDPVHLLVFELPALHPLVDGHARDRRAEDRRRLELADEVVGRDMALVDSPSPCDKEEEAPVARAVGLDAVGSVVGHIVNG